MASHLPLADQLLYTSGGCAAFALACRDRFGGEMQGVIAKDPRTFEAHDHPKDVRLALHAFVRLPDGNVLDAEGVMSQRDMLWSFGIVDGYSFGIETYGDMPSFRKDFGDPGKFVAEAARVIRYAGWLSLADVPIISGAVGLSSPKNYRKARADLDARRRAAPTPLSQAPETVDLGDGVVAVRDGEIYRFRIPFEDPACDEIAEVMTRALAFYDEESGSWDVPVSRLGDLPEIARRVSASTPSMDF